MATPETDHPPQIYYFSSLSKLSFAPTFPPAFPRHTPYPRGTCFLEFPGPEVRVGDVVAVQSPADAARVRTAAYVWNAAALLAAVLPER